MKISSDSEIVNSVVKNFQDIEVKGKQVELGKSNCSGMIECQLVDKDVIKYTKQLVKGVQEFTEQFKKVDAKKHSEDSQDKGKFGI
ncbi:hypothetical protein NR996_02820 [Lactobacillus rodentium]|uniref:Uncharacterized protein n=1 Tax=Lactobacillus rodentium TaxID=947835 RepID=A0A2Z6T8F1_9LACO|nr:hypothetical protein [Lactobacillus rodentium]MCR1894341.1 hypothetical protein [Lactobacillus rodentium]GBG04638.1 hypothetical protein LrDSM24759_05520 [Lactobacillus rodentium]